MDYSPVILKNKGVPTEFAKTQKVGDLWERVYDENGEVVKEELFVKFTNNTISDIEMHFGGLEAWQEKIEKYPLTTVRQTLAFVFRKDVMEVGEAMLDAEVVMYANVIGTSWSIANGVDPQKRRAAFTARTACPVSKAKCRKKRCKARGTLLDNRSV